MDRKTHRATTHDHDNTYCPSHIVIHHDHCTGQYHAYRYVCPIACGKILIMLYVTSGQATKLVSDNII